MNKIFLILLIAVIAVQVNARPGDPTKDTKDPVKGGEDAAAKEKKDGANDVKEATGGEDGKLNPIEKMMKAGGEMVGKIVTGVESIWTPKPAKKEAGGGGIDDFFPFK